MKELVAWLFSEHNSTLEIGLFDVWHFMYLFIVYGGAIALALIFAKKSAAAKEKVLRCFAYLTIGLYLADFFIMPLSDSYDGISTYKLPFNICTILAVLVPFAQFNKKFRPLKSVIVALAVAAPTMWMVYPGTALGGQPPFSYIIFQTFMYHGFLYTWGFLCLALGDVELKFKGIWKEFCAILLILVWADFGNTIYDRSHNWFFIESSIFPFLPDKVMPPVVVGCVFGTCFVVYCVYYAVRAAINKKSKSQ